MRRVCYFPWHMPVKSYNIQMNHSYELEWNGIELTSIKQYKDYSDTSIMESGSELLSGTPSHCNELIFSVVQCSVLFSAL